MLIDYVGVFADVIEDLPAVIGLFLPLGHVIVRLLILQPSQNGLIFHGDLEKLTLPCIAV